MNSPINRNIDIVCFSLSRWNAEISSPAVALAKEFAKTNRVFFIEHPFSFKDILFRSDKKFKPRQQADPNNKLSPIIVTPKPVLPINFLPPGKLYDQLHRVNNGKMVRELRQLIRRHRIVEYVFINFFDPFFFDEIPEDIKPLKYIYQCMDDMSQVKYTSRHGVRLENRIISKAHLVLCTSTRLVELKRKYSNAVYLHPNAADFRLFNSAATASYPRPAEMEFGGKKIIGFTGSIEYRTDFDLLKKIALEHPDKVLFLLGPVSGTEHLTARLDKIENIVFAGSRELSQLPRYLQHMDCCIIPYKQNTLTASIYPLKINEYLFAGKPVISTAFSKDIAAFADVAYIARSSHDFISLITTALNEDDATRKAARIKVAAENTWEKRVEEFWQLLT